MVTHMAGNNKVMLLAVLFVMSMAPTAFSVRAGQADEKTAATAPTGSPSTLATRGTHALGATALAPKARIYYQSIWGVDILGVKAVSSGLMLRFSYLVLDANRAKPLNDKKMDPVLIDVKSGAKLAIPMLEKVGKLRQISAPENGHQYWMIFSNKGTL